MDHVDERAHPRVVRKAVEIVFQPLRPIELLADAIKKRHRLEMAALERVLDSSSVDGPSTCLITTAGFLVRMITMVPRIMPISVSSRASIQTVLGVGARFAALVHPAADPALFPTTAFARKLAAEPAPHNVGIAARAIWFCEFSLHPHVILRQDYSRFSLALERRIDDLGIEVFEVAADELADGALILSGMCWPASQLRTVCAVTRGISASPKA
jgi:hypothetical protein